MQELELNKRRLIRAGLMGAGVAATVLTPAAMVGAAFGEEQKSITEKLKDLVTGQQEEVTPPEDLMREQGVLDRVLLLYEAAIRKLSSSTDFDPALISQSAEIIRDFINNYHEKSEEQYLFPRFKTAGKMIDLVDTLLDQHQAGRRVTETILRLAQGTRRDSDHRGQLVAAMQSFIVMYRPHAAREDTDLFPKLKDVVSSSEYDAMAEEFEKQERRLFGEDGFEKMTQRVARLEEAMGIHDLNQFTSR